MDRSILICEYDNNNSKKNKKEGIVISFIRNYDQWLFILLTMPLVLFGYEIIHNSDNINYNNNGWSLWKHFYHINTISTIIET